MILMKSILTLFFIINSLALCVCSVLYCLDYKHYTEQCGQSEYVITSVCVLAAIVFGLCGLVSLISFLCRIDRKRAFCRMDNFVLVLSAGCLVFSVAAGAGMLISLYFNFDPNCLNEGRNKRDFVFLWLFVLYAVISNAISLALSVFSSYKQEEERRNTLPKDIPEVFVVPTTEKQAI